MTSLKELDVSQCIYLENISEQIVAIESFENLMLHGCLALKNPSLEIVDRGMESVLGYFRRCLAGSEICRQTKLMLVGLGGAGKTKFVEALTSTDLKASANKSPDVTDGVSISVFHHDIDDNISLRFNIWDFAGQSVYYNTHQFFLSNRAIYLLLWNSRLGYENSGLDFWLSSISCHAPKAPIFIIATHADIINHIELPEGELKTTYPKIAYFAHISSITGQGMKELKDKLVEVTLAQPFMKQKIPKPFLELEMLIMIRRSYSGKKIMMIEEVEHVGRKIGLVSNQEVKDALIFLHELGSLQYFANGVLKCFVIAEPQWLVDAMTCLISVKESVIKDGRFTRSDISTIWSNYSNELQEFLLKLTEEFDLTFAIPSENVNIVPCMLPDIEQQVSVTINFVTDLQNLECFSFRLARAGVDNVKTFERKMIYKFKYLPGGLFNRIQIALAALSTSSDIPSFLSFLSFQFHSMSRLCQYSEESKIWKCGSLLNKNKQLALLKQTSDKELHVTVQGSRPENVLYLIHEVIETLINASFQGVSYDILVPCPACIKENFDNPHMFSRDHVSRADKFKAPFLQCFQRFHVISIETLRGILPPSTMNEYEHQLLLMSQQLKDLRFDISFDVCIICGNDNVDQDTGVSPERIEDNFKLNKVSCNLIKVNSEADVNVDKVMQACLVVVCVSSQFYSSKNCVDMYSLIQQSNKQMIFAIIGSSHEWQTTNLGQQILNEIYFDFQKDLSRFDTIFQEMLTRIKTRITHNTQPVRHPPIFYSYCFLNSADAAKQSRSSNDTTLGICLGEVDPRCLAKELLNNDIDLWVDYLKLSRTQAALFDEIAEALRHSQLFIACVSDEYVLSQNCLREYRFASAMQLPTIICVVGKGDNWQKSEINLLALNAAIYNFQIYSKSTLRNFLKRINEILKKNISARSKMSLDKQQQLDASAVRSGVIAYQELGELVQRKILQQANYVATKLKSIDASMHRHYPRIFFVDIDKDTCRLAEVGNDSTSKKNTTGRARSGQTEQTKNLYSNIRLRDLCIKWICEYEGGWHTTGESLNLQLFEENYAGTLSDFLDKISTFECQMLNLLKHSSVAVELMRLKNGDDVLMDLKQKTKAFSNDDFEISYRFLYRIVRQVDSEATRGGMQRCCLFSKKIVWMCPEHQKVARSFLADDDLDSEAVIFNKDRTCDQPLFSSPSRYPQDLLYCESQETRHETQKYSTTGTDKSTNRIQGAETIQDVERGEKQIIETNKVVNEVDNVDKETCKEESDVHPQKSDLSKKGRKFRSRLCSLM